MSLLFVVVVFLPRGTTSCRYNSQEESEGLADKVFVLIMSLDYLHA